MSNTSAADVVASVSDVAERRFAGVLADELAGPQRECARLDDLIERHPRQPALELHALRAVERVGDDAGGALFGLAEDDRLIELDRFTADGVEYALEAAAEVRHLAGDDAPVPAARLVEVHHLGRGVLHAEAAGQP